MRRYARFSNDYINESMENYDNYSAAAEELSEAYGKFQAEVADIIESYGLNGNDLVEVCDIVNGEGLIESYQDLKDAIAAGDITVRRVIRSRGGKARSGKHPLIVVVGKGDEAEIYVGLAAHEYLAKNDYLMNPQEKAAANAAAGQRLKKGREAAKLMRDADEFRTGFNAG